MRLEDQWKYSDNLKRKVFIKYELKKTLLRSIVKNKYVRTVFRIYALYKLSLLGSIGSKVSFKNRCVISGRSYNILKSFNYSRFVFREEVSLGNLVGWRRFSW